MINQYAWEFFLLGQFVEDASRNLGIHRLPDLSSQQPPSGIMGLGALAALSSPTSSSGVALPSDWLADEEKDDLTKLLQLVASCCARINIINVQSEIDRITNYVKYERKATVVIHFKHLRERIVDELRDTGFIHVQKSHAPYYRKSALFGDIVSKKLSKASADITNAGTCYALGQYTACVFHLMRVMEHCVQRFGKKLKVSINTTTASWYDIMESVNGTIKGMPGGKSATAAQRNRKQKLAMAAGRLDHVRIVWRNDVMHPKATYDQAEAFEVIESVHKFAVSFVELI
jgi:hypothetical protein